MFKRRVLVTVLSCILVFLVVLLFESENFHDDTITRMIAISSERASFVDEGLEVVEVDTNLDLSVDTKEDNNSLWGDTNTLDNNSNVWLVNLDKAYAKKAFVYDGMTLEELASKLDRSLKNELSGKGYLYASYSLEKGVDPYLAVAISLEETGCNWNCRQLVNTCNNVGGMKGSGCGSYGAFQH